MDTVVSSFPSSFLGPSCCPGCGPCKVHRCPVRCCPQVSCEEVTPSLSLAHPLTAVCMARSLHDPPFMGSVTLGAAAPQPPSPPGTSGQPLKRGRWGWTLSPPSDRARRWASSVSPGGAGRPVSEGPLGRAAGLFKQLPSPRGEVGSGPLPPSLWLYNGFKSLISTNLHPNIFSSRRERLGIVNLLPRYWR